MENLSNIEEKFDCLDYIEIKLSINTDDYKVLELLSKDKITEVRNRVAQLLALYPISSSESILRNMLTDEDNLVRANACDSLSFSSSLQTLESLFKIIDSDKYLVRGYAILSAADITLNMDDKQTLKMTIDFLERRLLKEKCTWVNICCYRSLCILGVSYYYNNILDNLDNRLFRNRYLALNCLSELINDENRDITEAYVVRRLNKEKVAWVAEKIKKLLNQI